MGRFTVLMMVLILAVLAYGAGQGWFTAATTEQAGTSTYELRVQNDRIRQDRDEFVARARSELEQMDLRLREMQTRAASETGPTRRDLDAAIDHQSRNLDAARLRLEEMQSASADRWEDVKLRTSAAFDDLKTGFQKAFSRFQ